MTPLLVVTKRDGVVVLRVHCAEENKSTVVTLDDDAAVRLAYKLLDRVLESEHR
jgi:hypothetical protein